MHIFIFLFSFFVFFSNGHYGGDGLENYLTAESIVLDGDISIYDRPFGIKEMKYEAGKKPGAAGNRYSSYGIGMPILLVPLYALGHIISKAFSGIGHDYITQFCVSLANPAIGALTALILFMLLGRLGYDKKTKVITVLCYSFCTMSLVYTRSGFSEPAVTLFVLSAFLFLHKYESESLARYALLSSALIGYSLLIKMNSFLYLFLIFFYLVYKGADFKSARHAVKLWLAVIIPVSCCFILSLFIYFMKRSNAVDPGAGIETVFTQKGLIFGPNFFKGLFYYLLSAGKGYFYYNAPLILAFFGIRGLLKQDKKFTLYILAFIIINFLFYAYIFLRGSIFSWGPRYLYPTIPFMCIFLAEFIQQSRAIIRKLMLILFSALGFLVQLPCLFISFSRYLLFVKEGLSLQEYFINFIPELSPIRGSWYLFTSAVGRVFGYPALNFEYNPDYWFVKPVIASMKNYDIWDVWWVNVPAVSPGLLSAVISAMVILAVILVISVISIRRSIYAPE
ncbi:MAG: glycosyltransferase family 39 protein [Candidatus Omnitrophota bacterium]